MKGSFLAVALTWDGTRWPVRSLPPAAKKFLAGGFSASAKKVTELLAKEKIAEIRICWVPQLRGGAETLCLPFTTPRGKRISFQIGQKVRLGKILGVSYRKNK